MLKLIINDFLDFQSKTTNDSDQLKEVFMSKVLIGTKGHLYVYKVSIKFTTNF